MTVTTSCGRDDPTDLPAVDEPAYVTPSVSYSAPAPAHNYVDEEGGTYFYVTAVSDEERKKGKAAGDVLSYRYFGRNGKGQNVVGAVDTNGHMLLKAYCSNPCAIIKFEDGDRIPYNPSSIIGSVFQDAMNGLLESVGPEPSTDQTSYPRTVKSIPKAFQADWHVQAQNECGAKETRLILEANKSYIAGVEWNVADAYQFSADEIDLHIVRMDENGRQAREKLRFKLIDKGATLASQRHDILFHRCPSA